jgi:hypothetical protein
MGRNYGLEHNRGEMIELIVRDSSGAKLDNFKFPIADFQKILAILARKYGIKFDIKQGKMQEEKDLEWLRKGFS